MNITETCQFLKVSRASYYRWEKNPVGLREQQGMELDRMIKALFIEHKERYGAERIRRCLKGQGVQVSTKRVSTRRTQFFIHTKDGAQLSYNLSIGISSAKYFFYSPTERK